MFILANILKRAAAIKFRVHFRATSCRDQHLLSIMRNCPTTRFQEVIPHPSTLRKNEVNKCMDGWLDGVYRIYL